MARDHGVIPASCTGRFILEVDWKVMSSDAEYAEYAVLRLANNAHRLGGDVSKGFLIGGAEGGAHLASLCTVSKRQFSKHQTCRTESDRADDCSLARFESAH